MDLLKDLVLPKNQETIKLLNEKLKEYEARLKETNGSSYFKEDARCKIEIVKTLLLEGKVQPRTLFDRLKEKNRKFDPFNRFSEACEIIQKIIQTADVRAPHK
jgi:hypothetical protein